jgi:hypothetical protein
MRTQLESRVAARFGVLPNFFRLTTDDPTITEKLWGFAKFAYLDNPLPSLLKERLFVYLSLFCSVRYCIARHLDSWLAWVVRRATRCACLNQLMGCCRCSGVVCRLIPTWISILRCAKVWVSCLCPRNQTVHRNMQSLLVRRMSS